MLGRPPRGRWKVARRCACGLPQVIETGSHLDDGTPFPTLWWLTCRSLSRAVRRLEAAGAPGTGMRVAAIDAGTNTPRLLVAEVQEGGLTQVERRLIFSRLGEGVDATGRLSPRGIKATAAAIGEFVDRSRELGAV